MKRKGLSIFLVFMLGMFSVFATEKTETFEVKGGDCEECKVHIETTATGVEGVSAAEWDAEKQKLTVVFDNEVTSLDAIEKKIAISGNDTQNYKALEEAYNALPECCQYEREE
nr:heavy-metal-associated domain-containing protein [uncultured Draconibacterium sp.]